MFGNLHCLCFSKICQFFLLLHICFCCFCGVEVVLFLLFRFCFWVVWVSVVADGCFLYYVYDVSYGISIFII